MSVRPKRPGAGLYMSEKRFDRNRQNSERYRKKPSGPRMQQSGKKQSGPRMQQSGNRSGNHENQVQNCNERDQNQKGKRMDRREPSDKTAVKVHKPLVYPCPVFEKCGGCQYLVYSYEEQLHMKQERVQSLLKPYCHVRPVIAMEDPMHYRCKVSAAFGHRRDGSIISGTYQANSHYIVPVDSCLIENETADAINYQLIVNSETAGGEENVTEGTTETGSGEAAETKPGTDQETNQATELETAAE